MAIEIEIATGIGTEIVTGTLQAQTAIRTTIGTQTTIDILADLTDIPTTATRHPTIPTDTLQIDTRTTDTHQELGLIGTHLKDIPSIGTPRTAILLTGTRLESDTLRQQTDIHQQSTAIRLE